MVGYVGMASWLKKKCITSEEYSFWLRFYWGLELGHDYLAEETFYYESMND